MVYDHHNQPDPHLYDMTGRGADWKKTQILDHGNPSREWIIAEALDASGRFCLLLFDDRANSLVLGCLDGLD